MYFLCSQFLLLAATYGPVASVSVEKALIRREAEPHFARRTHPADVALPKVFCFAFTISRPNDLLLLEHVAKQLKSCDDYRIFGDFKHDLVTQVLDPPAGMDASDSHYLNMNMIGLIPGWARIFQDVDLQQYDWFVNLELDHFVRPSLLRQALRATAEKLQLANSSLEADPSSLKSFSPKLYTGAVMLVWGNVFSFNRQLAKDMKTQWGRIGQTVPTGFFSNQTVYGIPSKGGKDAGCPSWIRASATNSSIGPEGTLKGCAQDMAYNDMVEMMAPSPLKFGDSITTHALGKDCSSSLFFDMSIYNENDTAAIDFIERLARNASVPNRHDDCSVLRGMPDTDVVFLHRVNRVVVHQKAMQLLGA